MFLTICFTNTVTQKSDFESFTVSFTVEAGGLFRLGFQAHETFN